jgi:hypothetical protein
MIIAPQKRSASWTCKLIQKLKNSTEILKILFIEKYKVINIKR